MPTRGHLSRGDQDLARKVRRTPQKSRASAAAFLLASSRASPSMSGPASVFCTTIEATSVIPMKRSHISM